MHRFCDPGQTFRKVHAEGDGQLQVQDLAGGGVDAVRILYHDPHCAQHHSTDDEGISRLEVPACAIAFDSEAPFSHLISL